MQFFLQGLVGYLIGSLPIGYLLSKKYCNVDIRKLGSNSTGATNVLRVTGNKKLALFTLLGDAFKGIILSILFYSSEYLYLSLFCCLLGHVYPVWLGFKGGKGVSTSAGIFLTLCPQIAIVSIAIWFTLLKTTRTSSVASLALGGSFVLLSLMQYFYGEASFDLFLFSFLIFLFLCFTHKSNLKRLITKHENVLDSGKLS